MSQLKIPSSYKVVGFFLPVLIPLFILLQTGLSGINFGPHPDEGKMIEQVQLMLDRGVLIPTFYKKPSIIYLPIMIAMIPDIPSILADVADAEPVDRGGDIPIRVLPTAATYADGRLLLPARIVSLVITASSVIWTYMLVWMWRRSWRESLLAACLIGLSWETAYHLRWVAVDGYMMLFTALAYWFMLLHRRQPERRAFLWAACAAGGFAVSSKYTMGLILIPLLILVYQTWDHTSRRLLLKSWLKVIGIFGLAYLLTTPGTLIAPEHFIQDLIYEIEHYSEGHRNYTVEGGIPHLLMNLEYLSMVLFSPYRWLALPLFLMIGLGIYATYREDRALLLLMLSFPVIYLLYMSSQSVMMVRNLLPLVPILAVFSARGIAHLIVLVPVPPLRYGIALALVAVFALNSYWLVDAAQRINARMAHALKDPFFDEFVTFVYEHPDSVFSVTHDVWFSMVADRQLEAPPNVRRADWYSDDVDYMVLSQNELRREIPLAVPELFAQFYHQRSVNPVYYPSMAGESYAGERRVMVVPIATAHQYRLPEMWDEQHPD